MLLKVKHWLLALAITLPFLSASAQAPNGHSQPGGETSPERVRLAEAYAEALLTVRENYAGQVDGEKVVKSSILGMLRTLDPHSTYLDRKAWQKYKNEQNSRYSGIGSIIGDRSGRVYIVSPIAGTPAYRAGLRYGDHIIEVNGASVEGLSSQQVSSRLLGAEGTDVTLKVKRLGVSEPIQCRLTRAAVPLPSITTYFLINKEIGYINLQRGFNTTTHDELLKALSDLRERGMKSLILDLRGNRGGLVDQAWKVGGVFLYRGQKIASISGRPPKYQTKHLLSYNYSPEDYPLVVLTNNATASSAEILAGALQDHDRALIIGEGTFGKGLVQNVFELSDGSALTLTTGKYRTPSGRLIQRDYSNQSFYDYYRRRNVDSAARDSNRHLTDSGRVVFGGGGITPDILVAASMTEAEMQNSWIDSVFEFVRHAATGNIPALSRFKLDRQADHSHRLGDDEYVIDASVIQAFKSFAAEHKGLRVDEGRIDRDVEFLKRLIRHEFVTAAYGQDAAYQVLINSDAQLQRAVSEMPRARVMAEAFHQRWGGTATPISKSDRP
jgi:carboxyl-terminal processing protease